MFEKIKEVGRKIILYSSIAALGIVGCDKDEFSNLEEENQIGELEELYPNVKTLGSNDLTNVTTTTISFDEARELLAGDVVVGGISSKTPNGIMRKITSVSSDKKTYQTTNATLDEIIQNDEINFSKSFSQEEFESTSTNKSIKKLNDTKGYNFGIEFKKIIFDEDGDTSTTNDQIEINGHIYFDLETYSKIGIKEKKINFNFKTEITEESKLEAIARTNFVDFEKEVKIWSLSGKPFLVPGSPIPLVARPLLELYVGASGQLESEIKTSVSDNFFIESEINYFNGWTYSCDFENEFIFEEPETRLNGNFRAYVSPKLSLIFNELVGPSAEVEGYLELDIDANEEPWWELYAGLEAKLGLKSGFITKSLGDYEKTVLERREKIAEAQIIENTPPIANFYFNPEEGTTETTFEFTNNSTDQEQDIYTLQERWDFESDGVWDTNWTFPEKKYKKFETPGDKYVKLEVPDNGGLVNDITKKIFVEEVVETELIDPRDNQKYKIIKIGNQTWMQENMNFNSPYGSCYYNNDSLNYHQYGKLYNRSGAYDACPAGWRLPTRDDWCELIRNYSSDYLCFEEVYSYENKEVIEELKNPEGFNSIFSGCSWYVSGDEGRNFMGIDEQANYWINGNDSYGFYFRTITDEVIWNNSIDGVLGYSVRCIKNE